MLSFGRGRSYGDCCLNDGEAIVKSEKLNHFLSFNEHQGILDCEAGVSFEEILNFSVPRGWFLSVTPGTKQVTLGGAIANDVHGKNHHVAGSFGSYIKEIEILRSNGERISCSPTNNQGLFSSTIGGLGLTGFILRATISMKKIESAFLVCRNISFRSIDEFLEISPKYSGQYEYSVAWLDCASKGYKFGRGVLMCGRHATLEESAGKSYKEKKVSIPLDFPSWFLNTCLVRGFNNLYYYVNSKKDYEHVSHYNPFFYPLDVAKNWNRLYGKKGFFQFQCVVPAVHNNKALRALLDKLKRSSFSSYLTVLKEFGNSPSPGLISFPRPGMTICFDLPNQGKKSVLFLEELNSVVVDFGGAIYPAKDATMSPKQFFASYPRIGEFKAFIDPAFSSSFWRRVTKE